MTWYYCVSFVWYTQTRLHVDSQIKRKLRKLIDIHKVDIHKSGSTLLSLELKQHMQRFASLLLMVRVLTMTISGYDYKRDDQTQQSLFDNNDVIIVASLIDSIHHYLWQFTLWYKIYSLLQDICVMYHIKGYIYRMIYGTCVLVLPGLIIYRS